MWSQKAEERADHAGRRSGRGKAGKKAELVLKVAR